MFVVAGEALLDVFDAGATPTGQHLDARIGGSPYNVALGLARLARPVAFCAAVSRGFLGERLVRSMVDEGIDTRTVQRVEAPVSMCLVGLDAQGVPRYDFIGERGADRQLSLEVIDHLPKDITAVHVGSYAMVVEPVARTQRELVRRLAGQALVAYDPNVRLVVEPSLERWRAVLDDLLPDVDLLKISDEDLGLLYPGADEAERVAHWLSAGPQLVVVTRGGQGATAYTAHGRVDVPSVKVEVVDTVGAGDTFQAALLTGLAETGRASRAGLQALAEAGPGPLRELLDFGVAAAAITCSRRGADLPRRAELPPLAG